VTGSLVKLQIIPSGAFFALGIFIDGILDTIGDFGGCLARVVCVVEGFEGGDFATHITGGDSVFNGHIVEGIALGALLGGLVNLITLVIGIDHLNTGGHVSIENPSICTLQTPSSGTNKHVAFFLLVELVGESIDESRDGSSVVVLSVQNTGVHFDMVVVPIFALVAVLVLLVPIETVQISLRNAGLRNEVVVFSNQTALSIRQYICRGALNTLVKIGAVIQNCPQTSRSQSVRIFRTVDAVLSICATFGVG